MKLHNAYRLPFEKKKVDYWFEELFLILVAISWDSMVMKDLSTIEKHDIHHYNEISYISRKTKDNYHFLNL